MRKLLYILSLSLLVTTCNDGDVITAELDFDNTFKVCGDLVFYKTKTDPAESLSIQISDLTISDLLAVDENNTLEISRTINGTSNLFNYRTYSAGTTASDYFCNDVPPSNLNITNDSESTTGLVTINTVLTEDDNDGIPAEFEDINGNGNLDDDDTDLDTIPNYLDDDDDGDNVPTVSENPNYTEENELNTAQDTDSDGIPDYLDPDDDGDGVNTRDEENNSQDKNPLNDITNVNEGVDFLNPNVNSTVPATGYRIHKIKQTFEISLIIENFQLPNLMQDLLDFGTLNDTSITSDERNPTTVFID